MAHEFSQKKVFVGLSLQSDRYTKETGPADVYIIPAAQALLDAPRKFLELRGEASQHVIGVVPLAYNTQMSLGIFAYPEKAGMGELLAMTVGDDTVTELEQDTVFKHTFTPSDLPALATVWQKEKAGELKAWSMAVNKLSIEVPNNGEMKFTADLLGAGIETSNDMGTPNANSFPAPGDAAKVFRSGLLTLNYGQNGDAIRVNVKDVKIDIDRGIKIEEGICQDLDYPLTIVPTQNLLTAEIEFLQEDLIELKRSWGGTNVSTPQSVIPEVSASLKYDSKLISGTYHYSLELDIPAAHVKYTPIEKGGRRAGRITLTPVASPESDPYSISIVNTVESPYTP